jgi:Fe-S oxidoreductase
VERPIGSSGALELELGLVEEARAAATAAGVRIGALGLGDAPGPVLVSADPHLAWMLGEGVRELGLPPVARVDHLATVLADPAGSPPPAGSGLSAGPPLSAGASSGSRRAIAYHDPGVLARRLDVHAAPRRLLDACRAFERREARTAGRLARSDGGLPAALGEPTALGVARLRLAELRSTGAELVVTASPVALMALRAGGGPDAAQDLFVVLDQLSGEEGAR